MKKIVIEMPDNIDCLIVTYLQSKSLGNITIGQMVLGTEALAEGIAEIDPDANVYHNGVAHE